MNKQSKTITGTAVCVLIVLSLVAAFVKIMTGFDIDEAYALALPYRALQGDRLFQDMWEVHQTSYFMPYLFIKLYAMIMPSMEYLVLYMRAVTAVIHIGMSVLVYVSCKKPAVLEKCSDGKAIAFIAALIYCSFLPKWMLDMDFSMQQLWFFTLFLIFLFKGIKTENTNRAMLFLFLSGLSLAMDVLAYPGMVLCYPAAIVCLIICGKQKKAALSQTWQQSVIKPFIWLSLGCLAAAGIFFAAVFRYMSLQELLDAVPKVFMDGAHQYDFATKLSQYLMQWLEVLVQSAILLVPAAIVTVAIWLLLKKPDRTLGFLLCIVFEIETAALITFAGLVVTWGPFRLQVRYIIQFAMALYLIAFGKKQEMHIKKQKYQDASESYADQKKQDASELWNVQNGQRKQPLLELQWIWWFSLAAFLGVLLASNVGPTSSASYLVTGNMLFVGLTLLIGSEKEKKIRLLTWIGAILFVTSLLMCKGFYMRNTEYVPGDITDGLVQVKEGPLHGIYVKKEDALRFTSDYHTIQENTTKDDQVLFMGTESLCNLYANGRIVSPTTISTPAFNEQWVEYFELYPEKQPTVIFLAKNTVDNREKFFAKNPFGIWIAKNYNVECMQETDSLCIIRKR